MSGQARSKERVRIPHNGAVLEQHEEFWFADGNLVLVARDTAFRIYRGLLTVQLQIFEDMFASASSNAQESLDDCPVVHLSDTPEDLAHLLHVLLPTSRKVFYTRNTDPPVQFDEVFAVITVAHKYGIEDVEAQALSFLDGTGYFSSKLPGFQSPHANRLSVEPAQAIGAVILARLTDTPSMLPGALYRCCALCGDLLDGWTRTDGTAWYLAQENAKRCVSGRATIAHLRWRMFTIIFDDKQSPFCARQNQERCRAGLQRLRATIQNHRPMERQTLWDWSDDLFNSLMNYRVCECCHQALQARNAAMLKNVWGRLPEVFGLAIKGWPTA
ncbi:hypothetical protein V8D89_006715 [Ganoderma adspersum]